MKCTDCHHTIPETGTGREFPTAIDTPETISPKLHFCSSEVTKTNYGSRKTEPPVFFLIPSLLFCDSFLIFFSVSLYFFSPPPFFICPLFTSVPPRFSSSFCFALSVHTSDMNIQRRSPSFITLLEDRLDKEMEEQS